MLQEKAPKPIALDAGWQFDNSYLRLPDAFYAKANPTPVAQPAMAVFNQALAAQLGLNPERLNTPEGAAVFAGNALADGMQPIAQAYAGHQFGHFTMLGDGRAILLGEHLTVDGQRVDIQLKGPGQTDYSRRGDGRAALGPMLREYIISKAMHALGIPTTRSLAVVTTGERVYREEPLPGAVLTRIAASHIRVGTFQYAAARGIVCELRALADYTIQRHDPSLFDSDNRYLAFLHAVMDRQAALVAKWQMVGFIHGVMNTDNMAISGETIDYGPCAFMDAYDPATVFSSIDHQGRYAYGNQPVIAQWNLARFTETLLPLLDENPDKALELGQAAISSFTEMFQRYWLAGMRAKLGLFTQEPEDEALIDTLLEWMHQGGHDFTNTFRALSSESLESKAFSQEAEFIAWYQQWQERLARQPQSVQEAHQHMRQHNPNVIPRNHRVEEALDAAVYHGDYTVMHRLLDVLSSPYNDNPYAASYRQPAEPCSIPYKTFCGT